MAELSSALQNPQALITLAVLGLAVVLFITGVIAPELTGLLSLSLLIATGVLNPQEALAGFGSPALITLLGLFPVSAALFKSGALDRLRALIASERIRSSRRLIALMAFVIAEAGENVVASIDRFHQRRHALGIYLDASD